MAIAFKTDPGLIYFLISPVSEHILAAIPEKATKNCTYIHQATHLTHPNPNPNPENVDFVMVFLPSH